MGYLDWYQYGWQYGSGDYGKHRDSVDDALFAWNNRALICWSSYEHLVDILLSQIQWLSL
jgi:hypothetical protein